MEALLSCSLVLLSVNITARPDGGRRGCHDIIPPICRFYIVSWILLCHVIDRICICVLTICMYVLLNLFENKKSEVFLFHYGSSIFKYAVCWEYLRQSIFLWYSLSWTFILIHISKFSRTRYFWFCHRSTPEYFCHWVVFWNIGLKLLIWKTSVSDIYMHAYINTYILIFLARIFRIFYRWWVVVVRGVVVGSKLSNCLFSRCLVPRITDLLPRCYSILGNLVLKMTVSL